MTQLKLNYNSLLLALIIIFAVAPVYAIQFEKGDIVHISNLHQIEDDLYIGGSNVTVDGTVEGDLLVLAFTVKTNGYIENSVSVVSEKFNHSGEISGSLRCISQDVRINGYVGRSILSYGISFTLDERGLVEKDLRVRGETINIDGNVKGKADLKGKYVTITGTIENDLTIEAEHISINAPALIKGDLKYISPNQANIDVASGVTILGQTIWDLPDKDKIDYDQTLTATVEAISQLIAAFLLGLLLFSFSRKYLDETVNQLKKRMSLSFATGFLTLVIFAVMLVVLILSLAMIIVGYLLISGEEAIIGAMLLSVSIMLAPVSGFLSISSGVIFYCGKIVVGILLGFYIVRVFNKGTKVISRFQMLVGLTALTLIFSLPYIGELIYLVITIIGAGGIIQGIRNCRHEAHFPNGKKDLPPPTPPPSNNL